MFSATIPEIMWPLTILGVLNLVCLIIMMRPSAVIGLGALRLRRVMRAFVQVVALCGPFKEITSFMGVSPIRPMSLRVALC